MADGSKLDSQFILEANKSQLKQTQDELSYTLHRAVRSNKSKHTQVETTSSPHELRNQLRSLYKAMYEADDHFEDKASKLLHASIQKMQSNKKPKTKKKSSHKTATIPKKKGAKTPSPKHTAKASKALEDEDSEFAKPKRRQRRKSKQEERFTTAWNESILHKKIKVYWPLDKKFYRGVVSAINEAKQKQVLVKYGDGDKEWLNLKNENFMFYEISSSDPSSDDNDDTEDEEDDDTNNDADEYQIGDKRSEDNEDDDNGDIRRKKRRKLRKKSKRKSKKRKKKRKKKKKKSASKSPKSEKKKKRKKEIEEKKVQLTNKEDVDTMDVVQNVPQKVNTAEIEIKHETKPVKQEIIVESIKTEPQKQENTNVHTAKPEESNSESDKSSTEQAREAMSEDSNSVNKTNMESEEDIENDSDEDEDSDMEDDEEDDDEDDANKSNERNDSNDPWIDCHVTITIDGARFDGIVEERSESEGSQDVLYKIKFDASNSRQSEWVRANQMEIQQITTCDNFKIGDEVEVRENGDWLEAIGRVKQIYHGATGIIAMVMFPEFNNVFIYYLQRDVKKSGN